MELIFLPSPAESGAESESQLQNIFTYVYLKATSGLQRGCVWENFVPYLTCSLLLRSDYLAFFLFFGLFFPSGVNYRGGGHETEMG